MTIIALMTWVAWHATPPALLTGLLTVHFGGIFASSMISAEREASTPGGEVQRSTDDGGSR